VAVFDAGTGDRWTFDRLHAVSEGTSTTSGPLQAARGHSVDFLTAVLQGWRQGITVFPLEPGQALPVVPPPPSWCAHLKLTSATTGAARTIAFTAAQLAADVDQLVPTMELRPDWPNLGVISLAHSYGFSNLVMPLFLHGIPLILAPSPLPEALRRAAGLAPELTLPAVPALWRTWHHAGVIPPHVRLALSAGAPLPLALEQQIHATTGLKVHNFYGASECGGIAYDASAAPRSHDADVGAPVAGVHLDLTPEGCLRVHSPAAGTTYWPVPDPALDGQHFVTSDRADLRAGRVWLSGRASDLINVAGRKIAPEIIEAVLREHPAVRDCVVFGVPEASAREECIVACVETDETGATAAFKQFLGGRLPAWQVPRVWRFQTSPLVDARGKISRAEWRRLLARENATAALPESPAVTDSSR